MHSYLGFHSVFPPNFHTKEYQSWGSMRTHLCQVLQAIWVAAPPKISLPLGENADANQWVPDFSPSPQREENQTP